MGKVGTVCFTFDDGRADNVEVFEKIMFPMGIPATLNVTTGYVDKTVPKEQLMSPIPAMDVDDVKRLAGNPLMEIANHSDGHNNKFDDIKKCDQKLREWLNTPDDYIFGFASPYSKLKREEFENADDKFIRERLLYNRESFVIKSKYFIRTYSRKIEHIFHFPCLFKAAYKDAIMTKKEGKAIYALPVASNMKWKQIKALIKLAIKTNGTLTLMLHSIIDNPETKDDWTYPKKDFIKICEFVKEERDKGNLLVKTQRDAFLSLKD